MTAFQSPTRFNQSRPLTDMDLRTFAPSVFACVAHNSRSERFAPIPTIDVIRGLQNEGWSVVRAGQQTTRDPSRREFTKHMLRFRKLDRADLVVGDNILEMLLVNGNDGSAAYNLEAGIFRVACLNGLIVKSADFGGVKVRHTGDAVGKVIEGSYEVLKHAETVLSAPQDWSKIDLTERERLAFARGAAVERWGENEETHALAAPIEPQQLLLPRRTADVGTSLWQTFNVIQENVMQGGQPGRTATNRRTTTRRVRGISDDVRINRGLWEMSEWLSKNAEAVK